MILYELAGKMNDQHYMLKAIEATRAGMAEGQSPFGACIVRGDEVLAASHNRVWELMDPSAHAEVQAIRRACGLLDTINLAGATIYSTCEPCPMCFAAIHWAKISKIVYGASIADAKKAGFSELPISNEQLKELGQSGIEIVSGFMRDECVKLFDKWLAMENSRVY